MIWAEAHIKALRGRQANSAQCRTVWSGEERGLREPIPDLRVTACEDVSSNCCWYPWAFWAQVSKEGLRWVRFRVPSCAGRERPPPPDLSGGSACPSVLPPWGPSPQHCPWNPSLLLCRATAQGQYQWGLVTPQVSGRFLEPQSNKWSKNKALNPESRKAGLQSGEVEQGLDGLGFYLWLPWTLGTGFLL